MPRTNKRRRIFYVDKIFQKKLLVLFLGINAVIVVSNIVYYMTYLKSAVEKNLYRSHIEISNINEIMAGEVLRFNIVLAVVSLVLVLVFYSLARLKLKFFFQRVIKIVSACRKRRRDESLRISLPEEFQEIHRVLGEFIQVTTRQLQEEDERIDMLRASLEKTG
jgi:hypothetical protein